MSKHDDTDDTRDGMLFRLWCRAGSYPGGKPSELARLFNEEQAKGADAASYRRALMRYAEQEGINLP